MEKHRTREPVSVQVERNKKLIWYINCEAEIYDKQRLPQKPSMLVDQQQRESPWDHQLKLQDEAMLTIYFI